MTPNIEKMSCIVCGKDFYRQRKKRRMADGIRKSGCLTCSKDCARIRIPLDRKRYRKEMKKQHRCSWRYCGRKLKPIKLYYYQKPTYPQYCKKHSQMVQGYNEIYRLKHKKLENENKKS